MKKFFDQFSHLASFVYEEWDIEILGDLVKSFCKNAAFTLSMAGLWIIRDWYVNEQKKENFHQSTIGCNITQSDDLLTRYILTCPNGEEKEIMAVTQNSFNNTVILNQWLSVALISLGVTIEMVRMLRLKYQQKVYWQSLIQADLPKLEQTAANLKRQYGSLYETKKQQSSHPFYLCEPGSKGLIDLPPIAIPDGRIQGYTNFMKKNQNEVRYFGVIDQDLLGHLLAYIQGQPLPDERIVKTKPSSIYLYFLYMEIFSIRCLIDAKPAIKKVLVRSIIVFTVFTGIGVGLFPKEITNLPFPRIATYSLLFSIFENLFNSFQDISHYFYNIHQQVQGENAIAEIKTSTHFSVPSLMSCPLSSELLKDPVFCLDGHTYEREFARKHFQNDEKSPQSRQQLGPYPFWSNKYRKKQVREYCASLAFKK